MALFFSKSIFSLQCLAYNNNNKNNIFKRKVNIYGEEEEYTYGQLIVVVVIILINSENIGNNNISNSSSCNNIDYNNSNSTNLKLPNSIIYNIISMVWNLRDRCTCIYDTNVLERNQLMIWNDESFIESFHAIKNQCSVHFSTTTTPYTPLGLNGIHVNRSRLQLSLISKDIFDYIKLNHFNHLFISRVGQEVYTQKPADTCMLKNNIRSISSARFSIEHRSAVTLFTREQRLAITKINYSNLTKLDIRSVQTGHTTPEQNQLAKVLKGKPITKLYYHQSMTSSYLELSDDVKQSLRCILIDPKQSNILDHFPNVTHLQLHPEHSAEYKEEFKFPDRIKKITCSNFESARQLVKLNTCLDTFKYYRKDGYDILLFLNELSKDFSLSHLKTFIYQSNSTIPLIDMPTTNFQLIHSRSKIIGNVDQKIHLLFSRREE
ncbi:hypothetical protein DFA_11009 [Cavenderia fasciculata]|uniref:Uncharacterized protein n=1 Tax=Cavenderia fasciculata TaxID=261658 RepID=F4QC11_CACFS|nr:uncharacterized protein DFA_11009 [Cavenderia fasciculata]EGG14749.1 hypothetical protein DFA_11009 [Cavenderia fasciculata]|eukprot:XP_004351257.1 hypothetical protein DFA_11009 [Cavenderia fasciculata]